MSTVPVTPVGSRPKRDTTTRSFVIATGFVIAGVGFTATGTNAVQGAMQALGLTRAPAMTAADPQSQAAAIAKLENNLDYVLREIAGLKARPAPITTAAAVDPSTQDHLAKVDAALAQLKAQSDALSTAQGETSEELSHIRAEIANADLGLDQLRTSIDDHNASERKAIADVSSRVDRLGRGAMASSGDVTGSIPAAPSRRRAHKSVTGWSIQEGWNGGAMIQSNGDLVRVFPGTEVPGLGRVTSVRQRGDRWMVTTDHGVIVQR